MTPETQALVDDARQKYGTDKVSVREDTSRLGVRRVRAYWHPEGGGEVGMRRVKVVDVQESTGT